MIASGLEQDKNGKYTLIGDPENNRLGYFDELLPCFGFGIGWFWWVHIVFAYLHKSAILIHLCQFGICFISVSMLSGFIFPLLWSYATILYFRSYYQKDPRERTGLAASAIAALIFTVVVLITVLVMII